MISNLKFFIALLSFFNFFFNFSFANELSPQADRGKATYMRVGCYLCHGTDGQGSGSGTRLQPDTLPPEAMAQFIRYSPGRMPAYSEKILSDMDLEDIVAFLESFPESKPFSEIIPLRDSKLQK